MQPPPDQTPPPPQPPHRPAPPAAAGQPGQPGYPPPGPQGNPPPGQPGYPPYGYPAVPPQTRLEDDAAIRMLLPVGRSPLAIAAGYAGLFALMPCLAPIALILGIIALLDLKRHPEKRGRGRGRAWFGLIMGIVFTLLLAVMLIGAAAEGFR